MSRLLDPMMGNQVQPLQPMLQQAMQPQGMAPQARGGFGSRLKEALPTLLMGLGAEISSGFKGGGAQFLQQAGQQRQGQAARNATVEWLQARNPELAGLVAQGALEPMQAIKMASEKPDGYKPQSGLGKLRADLDAGLITKEQFNALVSKETAPAGPGIQIGPDGQLIYNVPQDQKNAANTLNDERTIAASATKLKDTIGVMREAQKNAGYTGIGGGFYDAADQVIEGLSFGKVGLPGSPAARAVIKSGGMKFVLDNVQATKGAISNKEMELFSQAAPGLTQTPEGNKILLDIAEKVAERQTARLAEMEKWRAANNGSLDGFESAWAQYVEQNPILSNEMFTGSAPASPAAPADDIESLINKWRTK